MAALDDITIFLPTINRPEFLSRCLNFLSSYNEKLNIVIFDSSSIPNKELNKIIIGKHNNLNIKYIHENNINIKFYNLAQALYYLVQNDFFNTKYWIFTGDDDFLFIHNLIPHMDFLDNNIDYIVCHGNIIMIRNDGNKLVYNGASCSIDSYSDDPIDRFIWYCLNGSSIQYGVCRTIDIKNIFKFSNKIKNRWLADEVLPTILSSLYGKIKNLKTISCLQEWGHKKISVKFENGIEIKNWLFREINNSETWADFKILSDIFCKEASLILNKDYDYVHEIFEVGFSYRMSHTLNLAIRDWFNKNKNILQEYSEHHIPEFSDIGKTKINSIDDYYLKKVI